MTNLQDMCHEYRHVQQGKSIYKNEIWKGCHVYKGFDKDPTRCYKLACINTVWASGSEVQEGDRTSPLLGNSHHSIKIIMEMQCTRKTKVWEHEAEPL